MSACDDDLQHDLALLRGEVAELRVHAQSLESGIGAHAAQVESHRVQDRATLEQEMVDFHTSMEELRLKEMEDAAVLEQQRLHAEVDEDYDGNALDDFDAAHDHSYGPVPTGGNRGSIPSLSLPSCGSAAGRNRATRYASRIARDYEDHGQGVDSREISASATAQTMRL